MNKETHDPQAPASEQPKLREVTKEQLAEILEQHRKWVESDAREGARADLAGANLYKANLIEAILFQANLQGAYLMEANLQGAILSQANLQGADLVMANLKGASLMEANLQGAYLVKVDLRDTELHGANFREATLQDARMRKEGDKVEGARGLQAKNLAGADVSLATLPEDIHKFEGLSVVEEASKNARKIFISVLVGCVYSWLTIATTTDARLLTDSSSSPLPIIQTPVPIAGFYWAAPFVLLSMFVYFHLYLQRLWEALAEMPAVFPDGRPLDKRAYPWLLLGLVRAHFKLLQKDRPLFSRLQSFISILLAWWLVPFTLFLFWVRYLPRRDDWIWLHAALLVIAVGFATWFQLSARRTLRGQPPVPFRERWGETSKQSQANGRVKAYGSFLFYLLGRTLPAIVALAVAVSFYQFTPAAMENRPANLAGADVSTKPPNWTGTNKKEEIDLVKGADLRRKDLQNALANSAFLVKADLREAELQGADLRGANLQGAHLGFANLQGADLSGARLQGASLFMANLQGAKLRGARDLTQEQLDFACGDAETALPPGRSIKPCPEESN